MNIEQILLKPVITEKSTLMASNDNKYVFKIGMKANKQLVAAAIKQIYNVEPKSVNIVNIRRKTKRTRYGVGMKPAWKKAIITLKSGEKIDLYNN
jgi:large subunit ribosomal protein L23